MIDRPRRLLVLAVLVCVLFGLLVLAGTTVPDPANNDYPTEENLGPDYDAYYGASVEVAGTVVETDPVRIESEYDTDGVLVLEVTDVDEPLETGDELRVFGTAHPDRVIEAHETVVVSPWETYYTWAISFVAGLWVLARFLRGWRFDRSALCFEPREDADA